MFDIDFEAIALAILNRPEDPRSLPEELEAVRAELRVYEDMQANLNSNLAEYPDILDALETLQCSVFPPEEISAPFQLEEKYFDKYKELQKELAKIRARAQMTQDYRDNADMWRRACDVLQEENETLLSEADYSYELYIYYSRKYRESQSVQTN